MYLPDIPEIYLGLTGVTELYLGEELVWPASRPYVEVGCIQPNVIVSNQYAALPINVGPTIKWRFVGEIWQTSGNRHIGALDTPDSNDYRLFMFSNSTTYLDMGNKRINKTNSPALKLNKPMDITVYNMGIYDNFTDTLLVSGASPTTMLDDKPINIAVGAMKVNSFKVWETSGGTDVLIYDGVPSIRVEDGQLGLYDRVSTTFATNTSVTFNYCGEGEYTTLDILSAGTIHLQAESCYSGNVGSARMYYSKNYGTWTYVNGNSTVSVAAGDKIRLKANFYDRAYTDAYSGKDYAPSLSGSTAIFNVYGNSLSLIYGDAFTGYTSFTDFYAFPFLFKDTNVVSAADWILPDQPTYYQKWFNATFQNAHMLREGPLFKCSSAATTCFDWAFIYCTSLETIRVPYLNAIPAAGFNWWVTGVPNTGTFYKKAGSNWTYTVDYTEYTRGNNGIPVGWTVEEV